MNRDRASHLSNYKKNVPNEKMISNSVKGDISWNPKNQMDKFEEKTLPRKKSSKIISLNTIMSE